MAAGKVKWFNDAKGYGFIEKEAMARSLFTTALFRGWFKNHNEGENVEFEITQGDKGLKS